MIRSGAQIKAGRALLGWRRQDLAKASQLHPQACAYWERAGQIPPPLKSGRRNGEPIGVARIRKAFELAGVDFIDQPGPGVIVRR